MILDKRLFWVTGICFWLTATLLTAPPACADAPRVYSTLAIARMLASGDAAKQQTARLQLEEIGQAAMPGLICVGRSGPADQRLGAVIGLALMPIPEMTIDGLTAALADSNTLIRSLAAHSLAKIGTPAAPAMTRMLASDNHDIQIGAGFALSRMGEKAVPALARALSTDNTLVKAKIAWILGRMGSDARPAIPALIRALRTDDPRLLHVMAEAIDLIGANPAMVSQELILLGSKPSDCPFRLQRLGAEAAPTLTNLLARPGTPMAQIALYTLAQVGKGAEPALLGAARHGTPSQKTAAALLLGEINPALARSLPVELRESLAGALHGSE